MIKFIFIFFIYYYNFKHYESVNLSLNQNKNQPISFSQDQKIHLINLITPLDNKYVNIIGFLRAKNFLINLIEEFKKAHLVVVSIKQPFDGIIKIGIIKNIKNISYSKILLDQLILIIKKARLEEYCVTLMNSEEIKQWKMTETLNSDFIARLYCLSRYISNNFNPLKSKDIHFSKEPEISLEQILKYVIYFFEIIMNNENTGYLNYYQHQEIDKDIKISDELFDWFIHLII